MSEQITAAKITYGAFVIPDAYELPMQSLVALVTSGLAHKLGNEVAAKVSGFKSTADAAGVLPTDEQVASFKAAKQAEMFASLLSGEAMASARGPRGTAVETVMRKIATDELVARFKALGKSLPTGDKTIVLTGTDGTTEAVTRTMLVDRRTAAHSDRLRKEAEAKIAADRKRAEKAVAGAGGVLSAASLLD